MDEKERLRKVVDKQEIVLRGKEYEGRFKAVQKEGRVEVGSEAYESWDYRYYWKGQGTILDKQTGKEQKFLFTTWALWDGREWAGSESRLTLEEDLMRFRRGKYGRQLMKRADIKDYEAVVDLELQAMNEEAEESEKEEIVPTIYPLPLQVEDLEKRRLLTSII